ncbi:hypothetical protein Q5752_004361 [Cryptotrichosporon argae]
MYTPLLALALLAAASARPTLPPAQAEAYAQKQAVFRPAPHGADVPAHGAGRGRERVELVDGWTRLTLGGQRYAVTTTPGEVGTFALPPGGRVEYLRSSSGSLGDVGCWVEDEGAEAAEGEGHVVEEGAEDAAEYGSGTREGAEDGSEDGADGADRADENEADETNDDTAAQGAAAPLDTPSPARRHAAHTGATARAHTEEVRLEGWWDEPADTDVEIVASFEPAAPSRVLRCALEPNDAGRGFVVVLGPV